MNGKNEKNDNFIPAKFTSVWDNGVCVTTDCMVNMVTKEIRDIQVADVEGVEILEYEFITVNGVDYPASSSDHTENDTFYYSA